MLPSCVTFRDQHTLADERRVPYKNWSDLETYIHLAAAKDAIRQRMDKFEPYLKDGLPIAKQLYGYGAMSRHSVDMCDGAQFANIRSYVHYNNSFFGSMHRALDNSFEYWHILLKILQGYPELAEPIEMLMERYDEKLTELEIDKYKVYPSLVSFEEATIIFEGLCDEFEDLWEETQAKLSERDLKDLHDHLGYTFLSEHEDLQEFTSHQQVFDMIRTRIDMVNVSVIECLVNDYRWTELHRKIVSFIRQRAIKCAQIRLIDFLILMEHNPKFQKVTFYEEDALRMTVNWDMETTPMFRYFWLLEIAFPCLTRHQFLYKIGTDGGAFTFYFTTPDWVVSSLEKLSREKVAALTCNGVRLCSVQGEITFPNPDWPLTRKDIYEYMSSVMSICRGDAESVLDNLQGMKSRREWERRNFDKKFCAFDDLIDDYPLAIPWVPQTITMCPFFRYFEGNHLWLSPPFYTEMRGYKFALCVYPRGKDSGKDTHMSVGVCLMMGEHDDMLDFPVKGKIHVRLINQLGDHNHVRGVYHFKENEQHPEVSKAASHGADFAAYALSIDQFVPISQLEYNHKDNTQYLIEDKLYFQVTQTEFEHRRPFE